MNSIINILDSIVTLTMTDFKQRNDPYDPYIRSLIGNQFLTFIQAHPKKKWDWYWISSNPNITMNNILAHPDMHWNWDGIPMNPNILRSTLKYLGIGDIYHTTHLMENTS
jgi:hypothetical protein